MKYAIGIDVGGTTIKVGLVGTDAQIYHQFSVPTPHGPQELTSAIEHAVESMTHRIYDGIEGAYHGEQSTLVSIDDVLNTVGIDIPGIVNDRTGVGEFSANLGWRNFAAQEAFSTALQRPVAFGHDVRNGALAESYWGIQLPHFFYIAIGTGIASVLIIDSTTQSPHPWAGEIGQVPVCDPDSPVAVLPMERVASASALARRAHAQGLVGSDAGAFHVYRLADGSMSVTEAGGTADCSPAEASQEAQRIIDSAVATLAQCIAPALAAFGPIPVVIGGGLVNEGQAFLDHLHAVLEHTLGIIPNPPILAATLGSSSQVLGAALSAFLAENIDVSLPEGDS